MPHLGVEYSGEICYMADVNNNMVVKMMNFPSVNKIWWNLMPGTIFKVKWPRGWTEPKPAAGGGFIQMESADPNDHYRPTLEKLVGKQYWDWDWDWTPGECITANSADTGDYNNLAIKIRKGKEKWVTYLLLKWS